MALNDWYTDSVIEAKECWAEGSLDLSRKFMRIIFTGCVLIRRGCLIELLL